jgi:hypothetical protein
MNDAALNNPSPDVTKKQIAAAKKLAQDEILTCSCGQSHQAARKNMYEIYVSSSLIQEIYRSVRMNGACMRAVNELIADAKQAANDADERSKSGGASHQDVPDKQ